MKNSYMNDYNCERCMGSRAEYTELVCAYIFEQVVPNMYTCTFLSINPCALIG